MRASFPHAVRDGPERMYRCAPHLQLAESLDALLAHAAGRLAVRLTPARGGHSGSEERLQPPGEKFGSTG